MTHEDKIVLISELRQLLQLDLQSTENNLGPILDPETKVSILSLLSSTLKTITF